MTRILTVCGCEFEVGGWVTATCEHGRVFTLSALHRSKALVDQTERPKIVCLCGSTRFYEAFQRANFEETLRGNIVLSVGFYPHSAAQAHGEDVGIEPEQKKALDVLHFRKIDLADEVLVLNVDGYIGESTSRELAYARNVGKEVRFLDQEAATAGVLVRVSSECSKVSSTKKQLYK